MGNGHNSYAFLGWALLSLVTVFGCSAAKPRGTLPAVNAQIALTAPAHYTPYYSTQKARALGESYSENLDLLLERVTQSPIGQMQFANAIVSLSLGFFTHSASRPPDERYLEAILAMPDILEEEEDVNATVSRLFAQYGHDILAILASDTTIADDPKVAGYGINFSWRNMLKTPSGPRMSMREAVIYVPKKKSDRFLNQQIEHDELLGTSTIFVRQGEQPAQQIRYSPPPSQPWLQPPPVSPTPSNLDSQTSQSTSRAETQEPQLLTSSEQGALPLSQQAPPPPSSLQGQAPGASQVDSTASRTPPSSSQKQREQKLSRNKQPTSPPRRPPSPSPQQRSFLEGQLFDPPAHAPSTSETVPPPSSQRNTSSQSVHEGDYLVQFTFAELLEAQRWADLLKKEEGGYTTSLNFIKKGNQLIQVRVGRFASTAEANQFLDNFKAQGLQGLVLKGPQ